MSHLEADINYTIAHDSSEKPLKLSYTLLFFEKILKANDFIRIHRSFLVNKAFIKEIKDLPQQIVVLQCGTELPVSRRRRLCPYLVD